MIAMIRDTLSQMAHNNERTPCALEGGAYCANFEILPAGTPWLQAKVGVINIYFPFEEPPNKIFKRHGLDSLPSIAYPAWKANQFATVTFDSLAVDDYATYVDRVFRELFGLSHGYTVSTEVFDMR